MPRPARHAAAARGPGAAGGPVAERLAELAEVAQTERVQRGSDPLAGRLQGGHSVFLLAGEVLLALQGGGTLVVVGGSEDTRHALNRRKEKLARAKAITDVELLIIDDDLLDILATWDQVAASDPEGTIARLRGDPMRSSGRFPSAACAPGSSPSSRRPASMSCCGASSV